MTLIWFINIFLLILLSLYWVEQYSIAILLVLLLYVFSIIGQVYILVPSKWKKLQEKYKLNISLSVRVFLALIIFVIQVFIPLYGCNKIACKVKGITPAGSDDVFDFTARLTVALGQVTIKHAIRSDLDKIKKIQEVSPDEVIKDATDKQRQAILDFEKGFSEVTTKVLLSETPKDLLTKLRAYNTQIEGLQALEVPEVLPDRIKTLLNEAKKEYIAYLEGNIKRAKQAENKDNESKSKFINTKHFIRQLTYPMLEPALSRAKIVRAEKLLGIEEEKAGRYIPIIETEKIKNHDFFKDFYGKKDSSEEAKAPAPNP